MFAPYVARPQVGSVGRVSVYQPASVLGGGFYFRLMVAAYARTRIRKDVAWSSFLSVVEPAFYSTVDGPEIVEPARVVFRNERGDEEDPADLSAYKRTAEGPNGPEHLAAHDSFGNALTREVVPERRTKRRLPISQEMFSAEFDRAVAGGQHALFGVDELLTVFPKPDPTFIEKIVAFLRPDPWRHILSELAKSDAPLRLGEEIEPALRGADLAQSFGNAEYERIREIMKKLGREKKQ